MQPEKGTAFHGECVGSMLSLHCVFGVTLRTAPSPQKGTMGAWGCCNIIMVPGFLKNEATFGCHSRITQNSHKIRGFGSE